MLHRQMSEISKLEQNLIIKKIDTKTVNISINNNEMLMAVVGQFDQNLKTSKAKKPNIVKQEMAKSKFIGIIL